MSTVYRLAHVYWVFRAQAAGEIAGWNFRSMQRAESQREYGFLVARNVQNIVYFS